MSSQLLYMISFMCFFTLQVVGQSMAPSSMVVDGSPVLVQDNSVLLTEAGLNDESVLVSNENAHLIDVFVNQGVVVVGMDGQTYSCEDQVYRYTLYAHVSVNIPGLQVAARTYQNGGQAYPPISSYDQLEVQPLGPRELQAANGGQFISLPSGGDAAIKIAEFVGCRYDIPIQFRVQGDITIPSGPLPFQVVYSITASNQ